MTPPGSNRIAVLLVALLVALLGACGVPIEDAPRPLPTGAPTPTATPDDGGQATPSQVQVTLWFVRGGTLVPTPRFTTGPATSQDLIDLLVDGPTPPEKAVGVRSAVVSVVTGEPLVITAQAADIETSDLPEGEVAIVLQPEFKELLAEEQVLVLGEVVTTVAVGDIDRVLFVDEDGQTLGVPTADGRLRNGPVTAADYASLIG